MSFRREVVAPIQATLITLEDRNYLPNKCGGNYLNCLRAITNSVRVVFPEEIAADNPDRQRMLSKLYYLVPVLTSCNDWVDFGSRLNDGVPLLKRARNNVSEYAYNSLRDLAVAHKDDLSFLKIVRGFVRDAIILSRFSAEITPDKYKDFLDVDSMMHIVASLGATVPSVLEKVGFDAEIVPKSFEEMLQKYACLYTDSRVRGLHAMEMILKVEDDERIPDFDASLGLPSFLDTGDEITMREQKKEYSKVVDDCDLPFVYKAFAKLSSRLPQVRRILKDKIREIKYKKLDPEDAVALANSGATTMRTVWQYNPALVEMLRTKN